MGGPESEPESELLVKCNACEVCLCAANSAHNRNGTQQDRNVSMGHRAGGRTVCCLTRAEEGLVAKRSTRVQQ